MNLTPALNEDGSRSLLISLDDENEIKMFSAILKIAYNGIYDQNIYKNTSQIRDLIEQFEEDLEGIQENAF